jgi:hypothetical protein
MRRPWLLKDSSQVSFAFEFDFFFLLIFLVVLTFESCMVLCMVSHYGIVLCMSDWICVWQKWPKY